MSESGTDSRSDFIWLMDKDADESRPEALAPMSNGHPSRLGRFMEALPSWLAGSTLVVLGLILLWLGRGVCLWNISFKLQEPASAVGEALLVAGVLALLVDPFLKARLLREASRNIFEHMIGFDHEPELREKIRNIAFETKLYRRDFSLTCKIGPLESGDGVSLALHSSAEIINQSLRKVDYTAEWIFVEADKASDCEFTEIVSNGTPQKQRPPLKRDEQGYLTAKATPVGIQPKTQGIRYRYLSSCRVTAPNDYYHAVYFGLPTMDVTIKLEAPAGWQVWIPQQPNQTNELIWHTNALWMTAEHIEIHWRGPKSGPGTDAAGVEI